MRDSHPTFIPLILIDGPNSLIECLIHKVFSLFFSLVYQRGCKDLCSLFSLKNDGLNLV